MSPQQVSGCLTVERSRRRDEFVDNPSPPLVVVDCGGRYCCRGGTAVLGRHGVITGRGRIVQRP